MSSQHFLGKRRLSAVELAVYSLHRSFQGCSTHAVLSSSLSEDTAFSHPSVCKSPQNICCLTKTGLEETSLLHLEGRGDSFQLSRKVTWLSLWPPAHHPLITILAHSSQVDRSCARSAWENEMWDHSDTYRLLQKRRIFPKTLFFFNLTFFFWVFQTRILYLRHFHASISPSNFSHIPPLHLRFMTPFSLIIVTHVHT